ncbi:unnamed protein product [Rhizopus stolonifer]
MCILCSPPLPLFFSSHCLIKQDDVKVYVFSFIFFLPMLTTEFNSNDPENNQKQFYDKRLEGMMRFDSSLFCPMISPADNYAEDIVPNDSKDIQFHSNLSFSGFPEYFSENTLLKKDSIPCVKPIVGPNNCMNTVPSHLSNSHSSSPSILMNSTLFNNPVYEAFICGGLDPMMAPRINHNLFKDSLPSFTDLPSTVISGYNYDLDLTVGFDRQQCFSSGATTSSLMCCATQNTVLPERGVSHLPDLAAPDESVSSDEDNSSAIDDQDFSFSKSEEATEEIAESIIYEKEMPTESNYRQVEHKSKKHQQTVKQRDSKKITDNHKNIRIRKAKVVCETQSNIEKRTRKNYDREVINILMSWYLNHNGQLPDGTAKAKICKDTGKSIIQISTWFQNAKRRYSRKLEAYNSYSIKYPNLVYDSESLEAFLKSKKT